ncbi:Phosphatidylinositol 3-/4-kinase, catalytic domain-containing protein [Rozella allomycis CSF55]|uniref:Serine/threonine-protein kinase TEL1 n=1 Tax=Rozella allomycis (strain CSF55) TaxID=988480 RepID=A0A075AQQ0_ROZAC|nr:Phosphatidylinositol 3-/4-kinase, catalytic domain-containing protein [Rozella allomycis CSF55]|eukprot:EPZ30917.1 Phosphatidylinositol 3-/4-kinase, catalytic domain-containing protein [Rozella allomycis CSF55]
MSSSQVRSLLESVISFAGQKSSVKYATNVKFAVLSLLKISVKGFKKCVRGISGVFLGWMREDVGAVSVKGFKKCVRGISGVFLGWMREDVGAVNVCLKGLVEIVRRREVHGVLRQYGLHVRYLEATVTAVCGWEFRVGGGGFEEVEGGICGRADMMIVGEMLNLVCFLDTSFVASEVDVLVRVVLWMCEGSLNCPVGLAQCLEHCWRVYVEVRAGEVDGALVERVVGVAKKFVVVGSTSWYGLRMIGKCVGRRGMKMFEFVRQAVNRFNFLKTSPFKSSTEFKECLRGGGRSKEEMIRIELLELMNLIRMEMIEDKNDKKRKVEEGDLFEEEVRFHLETTEDVKLIVEYIFIYGCSTEMRNEVANNVDYQGLFNVIQKKPFEGPIELAMERMNEISYAISKKFFSVMRFDYLNLNIIKLYNCYAEMMSEKDVENLSEMILNWTEFSCNDLIEIKFNARIIKGIEKCLIRNYNKISDSGITTFNFNKNCSNDNTTNDNNINACVDLILNEWILIALIDKIEMFEFIKERLSKNRNQIKLFHIKRMIVRITENEKCKKYVENVRRMIDKETLDHLVNICESFEWQNVNENQIKHKDYFILLNNSNESDPLRCFICMIDPCRLDFNEKSLEFCNEMFKNRMIGYEMLIQQTERMLEVYEINDFILDCILMNSFKDEFYLKIGDWIKTLVKNKIISDFILLKCYENGIVEDCEEMLIKSTDERIKIKSIYSIFNKNKNKLKIIEKLNASIKIFQSLIKIDWIKDVLFSLYFQLELINQGFKLKDLVDLNDLNDLNWINIYINLCIEGSRDNNMDFNLKNTQLKELILLSLFKLVDLDHEDFQIDYKPFKHILTFKIDSIYKVADKLSLTSDNLLLTRVLIQLSTFYSPKYYLILFELIKNQFKLEIEFLNLFISSFKQRYSISKSTNSAMSTISEISLFDFIQRFNFNGFSNLFLLIPNDILIKMKINNKFINQLKLEWNTLTCNEKSIVYHKLYNLNGTGELINFIINEESLSELHLFDFSLDLMISYLISMAMNSDCKKILASLDCLSFLIPLFDIKSSENKMINLFIGSKKNINSNNDLHGNVYSIQSLLQSNADNWVYELIRACCFEKKNELMDFMGCLSFCQLDYSFSCLLFPAILNRFISVSSKTTLIHINTFLSNISITSIQEASLLVQYLKFNHKFPIQINWLNLIDSLINFNAIYEAIYVIELALTKQKDIESLTLSFSISPLNDSTNSQLKERLKNCYMKIPNKDYIYSVHLENPQDFVSLLDKQGYHQRVIESVIPSKNYACVISSLLNSHQYELAEQFINSIVDKDVEYETHWKLNKWDLPINYSSQNSIIYSFIKSGGHVDCGLVDRSRKFTFEEIRNKGFLLQSLKSGKMDKEIEIKFYEKMYFDNPSVASRTKFVDSMMGMLEDVLKMKDYGMCCRLLDKLSSLELKNDYKSLINFYQAKTFSLIDKSFAIQFLNKIKDEKIKDDKIKDEKINLKFLLMELLVDSKQMPFEKVYATLVKDILSSQDEIVKRNDYYFLIAEYAESEHRSIMSSDSLKMAQEMFNIKKSQYNEILSLKRNNAVIKMSKESAKQVNIHEQNFTNQLENAEKFKLLALDCYLKSIVYSDVHLNAVFKLVDLWFTHYASSSVNSIVMKYVNLLPCYKFIALNYQCFARLDPSEKENEFQAVLSTLCKRMTIEHPFLCILVLMLLQKAKKETAFNEFLTPVQQLMTIEHPFHCILVLMLLQKAKKENAFNEFFTPVQQLYSEFYKLSDAYTEVAFLPVKMQDGRPVDPKPSFKPKVRLTAFENSVLPVLTRIIPARPDGCYDDIVTIKSFQKEYKIMGGINMPKQIKCIGSDGKVYVQLVKGNDDLRQDAVMEQVFRLVNILLKRNANLSIRTYKIIPLTVQCGVIEFLQNAKCVWRTMAEMHSQFYPNDYSLSKCREIMSNVDESSRLATFEDVLMNHHPAFHHYFSKFNSCFEWFKYRKNYTCSVAVNSMVGMIVGLGDRHCQNKLLDKATFEIIEIDLNLIFEQGKLLAVPEVVPFRLTRNMITPMGSSGVNGLFKRNCEATLACLREQKDTIITILKVFKHDPLYRWTITPSTIKKLKSRNIETDSISESVFDQNHEANQVIHRVAEKLMGVEQGSLLSVEGHVNYLIQIATDKDRLSRMYHGWQAWL